MLTNLIIDGKRFRNEIDPFVDRYGQIRISITDLCIIAERSAKRGSWKELKGGIKHACSNCNGEVFYKTKYCPNCGAEMKEDEEDECT